MKRIVALSLLANFISLTSAYGQTPPTAESMSLTEKKEKAQSLFESAVIDSDERNFDKACSKLAAAQLLLPDHLRTAIALAQCYENWGHFVTARERYENALEVAAKQPKQDISKLNLIHEGLASATRRISYMTVYVPGAVGSIEGISVTVDLVVLDRSDWGGAQIPLNQGKHAIRATAPGRKDWQQDVIVKGEGLKLEVTIDKLEIVAPPPPPPPPPPAPRTITKLPEIKRSSQTNTMANPPILRPKVTSSYVGGGIALMLVGGGLVTGGAVFANEASSLSTMGDQRSLYVGVSIAGFVAGTASFITGLGFATASYSQPVRRTNPKSPKPTAALRIGPSSIFIEGQW